MRRVVLEIAVESIADAEAAAEAGADRLEVCGDLSQHGLTPDAGLLRQIRRRVRIPMVAMVRPRPDPVLRGADDLDAMLRDARAALDAGAGGIVFGVLTPDGRIDRRACEAVAHAARGAELVFHRAFDLTLDHAAGAQTLAEIGVTRLLSAGQSPPHAAASLGIAPHGAPLTVGGPSQPEPDDARLDALRRLAVLAAGRFEVMPGGGVRASNVRRVVTRTGARSVHSSCRSGPHQSLDAAEVQRLRAALDDHSQSKEPR